MNIKIRHKNHNCMGNGFDFRANGEAGWIKVKFEQKTLVSTKN